MIPQSLFDEEPAHLARESIAPGAWLLRGWALAQAERYLQAAEAVMAIAPPQPGRTAAGLAMSVASTRCGPLGWVSGPDRPHYASHDPRSGQPWPALPDCLRELAVGAAAEAGYPGFRPDSCLINLYRPGARLGLHQDRDERDLRAPIVSLSLGLPALFLWGGFERASGSPARYRLVHGDVLVWGGPSRLRYHGVLPLADGTHPLAGRRRINLTFRQARA